MTTEREIGGHGPAREVSPVLRGILWMVACGLLFGVLNTTQKFLTHTMHPPQVLCLRYLVGSAVLLPLLLRGGWTTYRPRRMPLLLVRGLVHVVPSTIWFSVLPFVTLAEQSAVGFTGPIFMMLGAWLFLSERMYAARWAAVMLAFVGVIILLWPGLSQANVGTVYTLWLLFAAPLFAISFLISKTLTRYESPEAIVFWLGIIVAFFSLPVAIFAYRWDATGITAEVAWRWPTLTQWALLLGCGLVGSGGHYCMTRAYQIADVSAVQPVRFLDLVWASLFGFIIFQHVPTAWVLAGGTVICAATLWITQREAKRPTG